MSIGICVRNVTRDLIKVENSFPCKCGHGLDDHFEVEFRKRESDWPCRICIYSISKCMNYVKMDNLKYLEKQYEKIQKSL
jgi:hypothetical protein